MKVERWAELAGAWPRAVGKAEQAGAPNWATCGAGRCGKGAAGPSKQAARCSCGKAAGTGRRSRPAWEKEKEKGLAGSVGPKWKKMNFSKSNHFPNLFPLFPRFKSNSNVI